MQVSNDSLNEFMALYRAAFGKDISQQDALEMAARLINLYLIIYRPLPGERNDKATPPLGDHRAPDASFPNAE